MYFETNLETDSVKALAPKSACCERSLPELTFAPWEVMPEGVTPTYVIMLLLSTLESALACLPLTIYASSGICLRTIKKLPYCVQVVLDTLLECDVTVEALRENKINKFAWVSYHHHCLAMQQQRTPCSTRRTTHTL